MAITKAVWRFQCDVPDGELDPVVDVFLKRTTTADGETFVNRDVLPVKIRFSELVGLSDLLNVAKMEAKKAEQQK